MSTAENSVISRHSLQLHAQCPIDGSWDYYVACVESSEFIDVAKLEDIINRLRGGTMTQEGLTHLLSIELNGQLGSFSLSVEGQHSHYGKTETVYSKELP